MNLKTLLFSSVAMVGSIAIASSQAPQPPTPTNQSPSEIGVTILGADPGTPPRLAVPDFLALSNDRETQDIARTIGEV